MDLIKKNQLLTLISLLFSSVSVCLMGQNSTYVTPEYNQVTNVNLSSQDNLLYFSSIGEDLISEGQNFTPDGFMLKFRFQASQSSEFDLIKFQYGTITLLSINVDNGTLEITRKVDILDLDESINVSYKLFDRLFEGETLSLNEIKMYVSKNFLWFETSQVGNEGFKQHSPLHWGLNSFVKNNHNGQFFDYVNAFLTKDESAKISITNNKQNTNLQINTYAYKDLLNELNFGFSKAPSSLSPILTDISGEYYLLDVGRNRCLSLNVSSEHSYFTRYEDGNYLSCGLFSLNRTDSGILNEVTIAEKTASNHKTYLQLKEVLSGNDRVTNYSVEKKANPLRLYHPLEIEETEDVSGIRTVYLSNKKGFQKGVQLLPKPTSTTRDNSSNDDEAGYVGHSANHKALIGEVVLPVTGGIAVGVAVYAARKFIRRGLVGAGRKIGSAYSKIASASSSLCGRGGSSEQIPLLNP